MATSSGDSDGSQALLLYSWEWKWCNGMAAAWRDSRQLIDACCPLYDGRDRVLFAKLHVHLLPLGRDSLVHLLPLGLIGPPQMWYQSYTDIS